VAKLGCDDGKKIHMTPEDAGMGKTNKEISLTEDAPSQLERASTADDGVGDNDKTKEEAGSDKPEEGGRDGWTLVDIESIVSIDWVNRERFGPRSVLANSRSKQ
jgi:hypothetical protein